MNSALPALHRDLQDLVGQTVAKRYRVDELIGVGGMAAVFRAHHLGLDRDVAFKVLHPNLTQHPEISSRFDREAKSASRLDHPNCVQVTDFGSTDAGMKFMVMQLLEGGELTQLLKGRTDAPRAIELILQVFRGLEHAHKQGVIHRDIKPENVFVTHDHDGKEVLKLVDFGIAKIVGPSDDDTHKTTVGMVFGTPAYMSPEQAMGMEADSRSDLYSTGVLLYQMLAGRLPLDNDDPVALVRMQVSRDPDPLPPSVPPVLAGFVARLLEKDRDDRYPSASQAIQTLEDLLPLMAAGRISLVDIVPAANTPTKPSLRSISAQLPAALGAALAAPSSPAWRFAAIGAIVVLLLAGGIWAFSGPADGNGDGSGNDSGNRDSAEAGTIVASNALSEDENGAPSLVVGGGPNARTIAEIDRLLLAKHPVEAGALLDPLNDQYPKNAQLLWRRGRVLAMQKKKETQALAAYRDALQADPLLLNDMDFYAQLHELMRDKKIRKEALDLALQHLGAKGHKFLLELVNDDANPLSFNDRQRALEEIRSNADDAHLINEQLNRSLDILQAAESLTPCASYRRALEAIAAEPDWHYYRRVELAVMPVASAAEPKAPAGDDEGDSAQPKLGDNPEACAGLDERREEVLTQLLVLKPEEDGGDAVPASTDPAAAATEADASAQSPGTSKKKSTSSKNRGCKGLGGIFKKRCR